MRRLRLVVLLVTLLPLASADTASCSCIEEQNTWENPKYYVIGWNQIGCSCFTDGDGSPGGAVYWRYSWYNCSTQTGGSTCREWQQDDWVIVPCS